MGWINIGDLQAGMRLASPVTDRKGRVLLGPNVELTEKHLKIFHTYGVTEADIDGISKEALQAAAEEEIGRDYIRAAAGILKDRFKHTKLEHEAHREMMRIAVFRIARKIKAQGVDPYQSFKGTPVSSMEIEALRFKEDDKVKTSTLMSDDVNLPALPAAYTQLQEALQDPKTSIARISNIINKDPALSARLIKMVNCASRASRTVVDTLPKAVKMVGLRQLSSLASGVAVVNAFKGIPPELLDMPEFWKHSIAVGICSRVIGARIGTESPERLFVAGLLHDIGRLIFLQQIPEQARKIFMISVKTETLMRTVESDCLNFDHALIGAKALKHWRFPQPLVDVVRYHHDPRNAFDPAEAGIVQVADTLAHAMDYGHSGETFVPPLSPGMWKVVGLPTSMLEPVVTQIEEELGKAAEMFA